MSYYTQNECYCYDDDECDVCRKPVEPFNLKEIAITTVVLPIAAVLAPPMLLIWWAKHKLGFRGPTG